MSITGNSADGLLRQLAERSEGGRNCRRPKA